MKKSNAQIQYEKYSTVFEEWVTCYDSGWYKEEMAQGAWIAWLYLTNRV